MAAVCICLLILGAGKAVSAQQAQEAQAAQGGERFSLRVNTHPLKDWAARLKGLVQSGRLRCDAPTEVELTGDVSADGQLTGPQLSLEAGDAQAAEVLKDLLFAASASGLLRVLNGPTRLRLVFKTGDEQVDIRASYAAVSAEKAALQARSYEALFRTAAIIRRGHELESVYRNLQSASSGTEVVLDFRMRRETFCALLSRQLSSY